MKWDGRTLAKELQRKDTRFSSEEKINTCMALDFLFTRTSWTLSWDVAQSPAGSSPPAWGQTLNITILQAYAPTSDYDENKIEEFYDQLQNSVDQTPKKDILVVQGDWNAKVGRDACGNWQGICGPFCNDDTNERGLRLLEFATLMTLCWRTHLVITKHPEDGHGIAQMDNTITILITF